MLEKQDKISGFFWTASFLSLLLISALVAKFGMQVVLPCAAVALAGFVLTPLALEAWKHFVKPKTAASSVAKSETKKSRWFYRIAYFLGVLSVSFLLAMQNHALLSMVQNLLNMSASSSVLSVNGVSITLFVISALSFYIVNFVGGDGSAIVVVADINKLGHGNGGVGPDLDSNVSSSASSSFTASSSAFAATSSAFASSAFSSSGDVARSQEVSIDQNSSSVLHSTSSTGLPSETIEQQAFTLPHSSSFTAPSSAAAATSSTLASAASPSSPSSSSSFATTMSPVLGSKNPKVEEGSPFSNETQTQGQSYINSPPDSEKGADKSLPRYISSDEEEQSGDDESDSEKRSCGYRRSE